MTIYTNPITSSLTKETIELFNKQYTKLNIIYKTNIHDRFIIIDKNTTNSSLYHLGASIKDAGKEIFSINKIDNEFIDSFLIKIK